MHVSLPRRTYRCGSICHVDVRSLEAVEYGLDVLPDDDALAGVPSRASEVEVVRTDGRRHKEGKSRCLELRPGCWSGIHTKSAAALWGVNVLCVGSRSFLPTSLPCCLRGRTISVHASWEAGSLLSHMQPLPENAPGPPAGSLYIQPQSLGLRSDIQMGVMVPSQRLHAWIAK